jgi:hypothetical protein
MIRGGFASTGAIVNRRSPRLASSNVVYWLWFGAMISFTFLCYAFPAMSELIYLPALFLFSLFFLVINPRVSPQDVTLLVSAILGIFTFYFIPMLLFALFGYDIEITIAPLSLIAATLIIRWATSSRRLSRQPKPEIVLPSTLKGLLEPLFYLVIIISIASALFGDVSEDAGPATIVFFCCFSLNIFIVELAFRGKNKGQIIRLLVSLGAMIGLYISLIWTGFGRIYLGMLAVPIYGLLISYGVMRYRPLLLLFASGIVIVIGNILRFGYGDYTSILRDSTTSGLVLTDELWRSSQSFALPSGIMGQFALFFFNWVPRQLWLDKPVAVGSSFVDYYLGRAGFGEGHSIALGVVGEHLYFMGSWWFPSLVLAVAAFILLRRLFARYSGDFVIPLALFDANLITFLWGGLAAFGARYFFLSMPALAASILVSHYARRQASKRPAKVARL